MSSVAAATTATPVAAAIGSVAIAPSESFGGVEFEKYVAVKPEGETTGHKNQNTEEQQRWPIHRHAPLAQQVNRVFN